METIQKGKQTNKQAGAAHAEAQMQGVVWSCVTCRVRYAMCQSMWKSFGDASEMHQKSMESDMQGHTLTDAKYPADYSELCPECNESIYLGMGGPKKYAQSHWQGMMP